MGILETIGEWVGIGSTIAGAVGGAYTTFKDRETSPAEQQMADAINMAMGVAPKAEERSAYAAQLAEMLAGGESDPRFAQLVSEGDSRLRSDYISSIDDFMTQDRRQNARATGTGSIVAERRDETRAKALMDQFAGSRQIARTNARNLLTAAANANNMAITGYTSTAGALTGAGVAAAPAMTAQIGAAQTQRAGEASFFGNLPQMGKDFQNWAKDTPDSVKNNPVGGGT